MEHETTRAEDRSLPRRPVLAVGGAAAAAALLTACGGGDSGTTGSGGGTSGSATQSGATSASGSAAGGGALAQLADVPVGGAVAATSPDGKPIIVAQPKAGEAVAFSARCTHMGCTVKPSGAKLQCPCHGSQFDALTGKVQKGPAEKPLADFPVKVEGGAVVAG